MAVGDSAVVAQASEPVEDSGEKQPRRTHWTLNLFGIAVILALCDYGETVLVVTLVAALIAFILAPIVDVLTYFRLPRALAAAIAVLLLLAVVGGVIYYSSNQAHVFAQDLPKYTTRVREEIMRFRKQAETLQVLTPQHEKGVINVRPAVDVTDLFTSNFGPVSQGILLASFVPFLTYFMLTWQHHVRAATVMLFPPANRQTAYVTLGLISKMIRSFMVGNLLIGLLIGGISTFAFWMLHIPFFYFIGFLSGFLSLIPYMGILLALAPPIFVGLGHIGSEDLLTIVVVILGLHVIAMNVFYPKFLGKRLQLNPLAVSLALLTWAWLWGAIGLLLAIPLTAGMKIIFDHVESLKPYGVWLGE